MSVFQYKIYSRLDHIPLTKPKAKETKLSEVLIARKSSRNFTGRAMKIDELSSILYYSAGCTEEVEKNNKTFHRRPYPSAGARYPLEIYPLVLHGDRDLPKGLYHYNPMSHSLAVLLKKITLNELKTLWLGQAWAAKASLILIITAVYERTTSKYGNKGISFCLLEAGHLAQNIYLKCQEVGVGCCAIGKLQEEEVIRLLDIKPEEEIPIYYLAIGQSN